MDGPNRGFRGGGRGGPPGLRGRGGFEMRGRYTYFVICTLLL